MVKLKTKNNDFLYKKRDNLVFVTSEKTFLGLEKNGNFTTSPYWDHIYLVY